MPGSPELRSHLPSGLLAEVRCWIVIPVKAPEACKSRLAPVLGENARQELVADMLHRTVAAAQSASGPKQILLLGPSRHGLPEGMRLLPDPGQGLNSAIASARDAAMAAKVDRLLFLSADMPLIMAEDVAVMLKVPPSTVALAPDRLGEGTNALSLPLPEAARFQFHYGERSFAAHRAEAARLNLPFLPIERPALAFDLDRPGDLALWQQA